jgi:hypothetical protein
LALARLPGGFPPETTRSSSLVNSNISVFPLVMLLPGKTVRHFKVRESGYRPTLQAAEEVGCIALGGATQPISMFELPAGDNRSRQF